MAQPKREESPARAVGHEMIGETLTAPVIQCDLMQEIAELHKEEAWLRETGASSKTLVHHRDLRIVLIAMRTKMRMHQHRTEARISVQTLAGYIRLRLPEQTVELPTGQLLALDHCVPHEVEAQEDSAFLLTLSWPPEGIDKQETDRQK